MGVSRIKDFIDLFYSSLKLHTLSMVIPVCILLPTAIVRLPLYDDDSPEIELSYYTMQL